MREEEKLVVEEDEEEEEEDNELNSVQEASNLLFHPGLYHSNHIIDCRSIQL